MKITIIAEIGINWGGDMETARELIRQAKSCGANIAKFQLYSVDALFPDKQIMAQGKNWYEEVKKTELTKEQAFELANYCEKVGIEFMASAFSLEKLEWLREIGVKRHKVASRMNKDWDYIYKVIAAGMPVLVSVNDINDWYPYSARQLIPLYCVAEYPTEFSKLDFTHMDFNHFHGFSDHTCGIEASMVAMARGAVYLEKHFCLRRDDSNPDMICSVEPDELKRLVVFARKVEEML